jgi:hypothetical protein
VILVTFAGRRDRMSLLARYVDAAIAEGSIDEWHIWDFSRNPSDAHWLRERFPLAQVTPSHSTEYFPLSRKIKLGKDAGRLRFDAAATNDVHIGLRRQSGAGASYEIIFGGWNNQASAIRDFDDAASLLEPAARDPERQPLAVALTPDILPEFGFATFEIELGRDGIRAWAQGREALRVETRIAPGAFEIFYRTGYGANGEFIFPQTMSTSARLFVCGPSPHHPADAMFYTRAYQYYGANLDRYRNDIFLKCDDDIVYFDLSRLRDFIAFRKENPQYFLVGANVVNNGACAYFQQTSGAIPSDVGAFELPPDGFCGSLWSSGAMAESLHDLFLKNPAAFACEGHEPIIWNKRMSINFVSWLGADLVHIPDIMADDEHELCYGVRKRARKANCIYQRFVASHLSFWKQDAQMNLARLIDAYGALADRELSAMRARTTRKSAA